MAKGFPPIPELLLKALSEAFPERSAQAHDTPTSLMIFEGGQRSVVRFLQARFKEQQAAAEELHQNVLVQPQGS
jgi:hypothetical protein